MFNYSNAFHVAMQKESRNIMINFIQEAPTFGDDKRINGLKSDAVASVVLPVDVALDLAEHIQSYFTEEPSNT